MFISIMVHIDLRCAWQAYGVSRVQPNQIGSGCIRLFVGIFGMRLIKKIFMDCILDFCWTFRGSNQTYFTNLMIQRSSNGDICYLIDDIISQSIIKFPNRCSLNPNNLMTSIWSIHWCPSPWQIRHQTCCFSLPAYLLSNTTVTIIL